MSFNGVSPEHSQRLLLNTQQIVQIPRKNLLVHFLTFPALTEYFHTISMFLMLWRYEEKSQGPCSESVWKVKTHWKEI